MRRGAKTLSCREKLRLLHGSLRGNKTTAIKKIREQMNWSSSSTRSNLRSAFSSSKSNKSSNSRARRSLNLFLSWRTNAPSTRRSLKKRRRNWGRLRTSWRTEIKTQRCWSKCSCKWSRSTSRSWSRKNRSWRRTTTFCSLSLPKNRRSYKKLLRARWTHRSRPSSPMSRTSSRTSMELTTRSMGSEQINRWFNILFTD